MEYEVAKATRDQLDSDLRAKTAVLSAIAGHASGALGLTPDAAKTAEWRTAKEATNAALIKLQEFNRSFVGQFSAEIRAERNARQAQVTQ